MAVGQCNGRKRLTDLEIMVIGAIAGGASDLETAARLCVSETTVRQRARSAMRKWAVSDRGQMVSLWADANGGASSAPRARSLQDAASAASEERASGAPT